MNYDEIPAGPELDAIVAEKVMGEIPCDKWIVQRYTELGPIWIGGGCGHKCFPRGNPCKYSTDIAAAWLVLIRFEHWEIIREKGITEVEVGCLDSDATKNLCRPTFATADETPLAICRAALKAVSKNGGDAS